MPIRRCYKDGVNWRSSCSPLLPAEGTPHKDDWRELEATASVAKLFQIRADVDFPPVAGHLGYAAIVDGDGLRVV